MAAIGKGTAPEGLRRLARKSLKGVLRDLQRARGGGESEIHDVRKGLKLVRSLLRMVKPAIGKSTFQRHDRALRQAHHLLAEARHRSAMVETLDKLETSGKERKIKAGLGAVRRVLRGAAASAETPADIVGLVGQAEKQVRAVIGELGHWDLPRRDISPFVKGMRLCYASARKALKHGLAKQDIAELHEARKSLIHFRHQLEMLAPLWPSVLKAWAEDLQDLREILGDVGDLEELDAVLKSPVCAGLPEAPRNAVCELVAFRRIQLIEEIKPLSHRLFSEKPAVLEKRLKALWTAGLQERRKAKSRSGKPAPEQAAIQEARSG